MLLAHIAVLLLPFKFYNIKIKNCTYHKHYPGTRQVPGYPRQPNTRAFNEFCTNFYEFFLISENSLKFAIFLLR